MDLGTFEQLLSPIGQDVLREIAVAPAEENDLKTGSRLRKTFESSLVAAAMTQHQLRQRAATKFGSDAAKLYFTPDALEQATRRSVSSYRANRLFGHGPRAVLDIGCSVGGDSIAFARAGLRVRGVDTDPVRVAIARANFAALELDGVFEVADGAQIPFASDEAVFIDPARRDSRGRVFSLRNMTPSWTWASALLRGPAVVKTMPGISHDEVPLGAEAEWISDRGDLVEACLWGVPFATTTRRATTLPTGFTITNRSEIPETRPRRQYLLEPDDAIIRAGLVAEVAADVAGYLLDPHIAYISTDQAPQPGCGKWFRIIEELPYQEKQLRHALQARDIGSLTIKRRGLDVIPEKKIRSLRLTGQKSTILVMTRTPRGAQVFRVEPVS